ncbi:hypothetical protein PV326_012005 [Microctonus aethiopoides]|nr:hypothetical protein PV326_012005 [Microctonus aethiopoides]
MSTTNSCVIKSHVESSNEQASRRNKQVVRSELGGIGDDEGHSDTSWTALTVRNYVIEFKILHQLYGKVLNGKGLRWEKEDIWQEKVVDPCDSLTYYREQQKL